MKILVDTIWTKVECTSQEARLLDNHFAITVPNYWHDFRYKSRQWDGKKHFFNRLSCKLPTGLNFLLFKFLKKKNIRFNYKDVQTLPTPIVTEKEPVTKLGRFDLDKYPYDYQGIAVRKALKYKRGVLQIATNGGKTIIATSIIKTLGVPTLFVVGSNDLLLQTKEVFEQHLDTSIGQFGGGEKSLGFVTVCTVQSVTKNFRLRKKILKEFSAVFWDEVHHLSSDTWLTMARNCPAYYRFGLSGTAFDPNNKYRNYQLMSVSGPLLMSITNEELIKRGVSAKPKIFFIESKRPEKLDNSDFLTSYRSGIVENHNRNVQIANLCKTLVNKHNHSVLVLCQWTKHSSRLVELIKKRLPDELVLYNHGSVFVKKRRISLRKFKRAKRGVMVASTIYDEGVDIPEINSLVLTGGYKHFRKLLQRIGRALRKKKGANVVQVFDFIDTYNRHLYKHSKERYRVCHQEGFTIKGIGSYAKKWLIDNEPKTGRRSVK